MAEGVLPLLAERFPERMSRVRALLEWDHEFRALCEDFAVAVQVQRRWEGSVNPEGARRAAEYRQLATEIALEIEDVLASAPSTPEAERG